MEPDFNDNPPSDSTQSRLAAAQSCLILFLIAAFSVFALGLLCGCRASKDRETPVVRIAEQYGLAYAPLQIAREQRLIEKALPDVKVEWQRLGNTAVIRESMIAGRTDIGFTGIPPFLIGADQGMSWKIFTGLSQAPLALMVMPETPARSLAELPETVRIALPQPGSLQHILLSMAAERELGDAERFDDRLVTLSHPDGMQALLAGGEIDAHFTSPPYVFLEEAAGAVPLLSGEQAFGGEFTFIVGNVSDRFARKNTAVINGVREAIKAAIDYMRDNPEETAAILAPLYASTESEILGFLDMEGLVYDTSVIGLVKFQDFMIRTGLLKKELDTDALVLE